MEWNLSATCHARAGQASHAAEKVLDPFCHSERSEESLFLLLALKQGEIPPFARNDKINYFFRSVFSLCFATFQAVLCFRRCQKNHSSPALKYAR
jgi:hypothetical protein